jgi:microcystin-dependent protein
MSEPYIGEIRMFGGSFAPAGWAYCSGQLVPISENDTLFTLIGTTYGGDGQETFALPDLQSRVPIHMGTSLGNTYTIGEQGGVESVTLTTNQLPVHTHPAVAGNSGNSNNPAGKIWANWPGAQYQSQMSGLVMMNAQALSPVGGSQPHDNMLPYLAVNFIISLFGIFPTQN